MKLPDYRNKLAGCSQTINGVNLTKEYDRLYEAYSRLYEGNWYRLNKLRQKLIKDDEAIIRKWGNESDEPGIFAYFEMGSAKGKIAIVDALLDEEEE